MDKIRLLLVEDEPILAAIVKESLEKRDFEVDVATNGVEGWSKYKSLNPDVCVIDVMMPRKDGFSLVTDIRTVDQQIPLMFLTARTQGDDVLKGLEIGADDYMKKPFSMEELILRLKALVRRRLPATSESSVAAKFQIGLYLFNYQRLELQNGADVSYLSQREGDLLLLLIQHKNQLLGRKTALLKLWGDDSPFNARSMDVYITRLRKYFKADPSISITNVRSQGYTLIDHSSH